MGGTFNPKPYAPRAPRRARPPSPPLPQWHPLIWSSPLPPCGTAWALSLRVEWLGSLVQVFFQWLCVIISHPPCRTAGVLELRSLVPLALAPLSVEPPNPCIWGERVGGGVGSRLGGSLNRVLKDATKLRKANATSKPTQKIMK